MHNPNSVLVQIGDYVVSDFMKQFWQREAYLARQAFPDFKPLLSGEDILRLATEEEVESRLIIQRDESWEIEYGPFTSRSLKKLPATGWTILVQGANLYEPALDALLRRFAFIPYARLDDLMVSFAVDGGGVGPHFDSYDVFLLQAAGQRRWSVSAQSDLTLVPHLPLKILKNFESEQSWVLEPGDMLYLPPRYAHDGVAVGECMTYSIGFRAPDHQEWAQGFLNFWHDEIAIEGVYRDAGLKPTDTPASIPADVQTHVARVIQKLLWTQADIHRFIGCYLTQPKDTVFFEPPARPMSLKRFRDQALAKGVALDPRTQWLYDTEAWYCNGEAHTWAATGQAEGDMIRRLANARFLPGAALEAVPELIERILFENYSAGFLHLPI